MITAFELAGYFAAHGIWCVSAGETLTPMLAYTREDGQRRMDRLALGELSEAVALGKQRLQSNEMDADDAVLVYDARIPMGGGKCDALILEIRAYFSPDSVAVLAVPYSPKSTFRRFRVHRPKLIDWRNCEDFEVQTAMQVFFEGVSAHKEGAKVWNRALDESS